MANRKISEFTALTAPVAADVLPIIDQSESGADKNKKIAYSDLLSKAPDGSASAPSFSFVSDPNSGLSGGSDTLTLSTGGSARITISSAGLVTIPGDLTVAGTTTTIDTTNLTVKDKNIEIAKGNGNDAAVDGAGITVDSTDGDKTWNWVDSTDAWTSSEHIDLASGKVLKVAGTQVLSATNFTGTSAVATTVTVADESSDTSCNVLFTTAATGNLAPKSGTNLTFNSDTGALTATTFVGALTGNASGSSGSCTGNAATATALATARAINGVNFDGTAAITVTAAAGTLSGATLASGVTASSLTSVGTLSSLTVGGDVTVNGQGDLRLADSDSSNYVGFQAPGTVSSNVIWTLPSADGSAGQFLKTSGSGVLSWATDATTDSTKMPLAGGTFTGSVIHNYTDAIKVPVGTTGQRPTGAAGHFRYNSSTGKFEGFTDEWGEIAGGGGGESGLLQMAQTVSTSVTLTTNYNAFSVMPTIASGVTVTVPSGAVWAII